MSNNWGSKNKNTPAQKAAARKYASKDHRAAREQCRRLVLSGAALCWRCGRPIPPTARCGPDWQTGHDDSGTLVMGPEHAACNRGHSVVKGADVSNRKQGRPPRPRQAPRFFPLGW